MVAHRRRPESTAPCRVRAEGAYTLPGPERCDTKGPQDSENGNSKRSNNHLKKTDDRPENWLVSVTVKVNWIVSLWI